MYQEKSSKTYTKYINRQFWKDALEHQYPAEKLEQFFNQYHKNPDELKIAIDNLNLCKFPDLLQFCLETLVFMSKQNIQNHKYYIEQILQTSNFHSLFKKELDIMKNKVNQARGIDFQQFQQFINYFLKFVEYSQKLQLKYLPQYLDQLESTVVILMRNNSSFNQQFQQIQNFKKPINFSSNNPSTQIQPNLNNSVIVNPGNYQQQNSQNKYQPRNYQVEYKPIQPQNYQSSSQNNTPSNQQQQNFLPEPIYNPQQNQQYKPRNYFNQQTQQTNQQQSNYQIQNIQHSNNDFDDFQMLQKDQYSQPQQFNYSNKTYQQQSYNQYQQNDLMNSQKIQDNFRKLSIQSYDSQTSYKPYGYKESPYVEKKSSQISQSTSIQSNNTQFSQTQGDKNCQLLNSFNQNELQEKNNQVQEQHFQFLNQKYDIKYYEEMKNFYTQKQKKEQKSRLIQMDNVCVSYKNCPIGPIISEFENVSDKAYVYGGNIFEIPFGSAFQSTELFLNNHFFILREDYLKSFRIVVNNLKVSGFENIDYQVLQNAFLYYNVLIENITVTNRGFQFIVTMNVYEPKNVRTNWQKTTRLMPGSLLLLSTTSLEFMLFGTVVEKPKSEQNGRVYISITIIGLSMKEQLRFVNSLLSQETQLIAIENKIYFEIYTHFLSCLQNIEPSHLPFADQIVFGSKIMPIPGYLNRPQIIKEGIQYDIDLKFDLHKQKQIGQQQRVNIFREWPKVNQESLDESQLKAIQIILKNGISLIQGPPGTGKTFCGALGVRILLQNQFKWNDQFQQRQNKPILIVCQTNHALDQFLRHILTFCRMDDIVRIGGRCKEKDFEPMLLQFNQQDRKIHFRWDLFLDLRDDLDRKLRNLLNLIDNVNYKDVEQYMPDLFEMVVSQYLEIEDLNFKNPIDVESKKIIMHMWLDNFKPREEQAQKIIEKEQSYKNYLKKEQLNKKQFKPILVYKYSDLDIQFQLNEDARKQLEKDEEEENVLDENQNLDSDEEENRKVLITSENTGKEEFIKKLINDSRTIKRLLNRLSKDNEASFIKIMNDINGNRNYKIWEMPQTKRNIISRYIFSQKFQYLFKLLEEEVNIFEDYINKLKQAYIDRDLKYIQSKQIVGVTLSGCAKYAEKLSNLNFNILIVEEAGEVLESNLVAVLSKQISHLILIGDHQQLKPHMECYELELKFRANISLFERLIKNGLEYVTLKYQRRMKSSFADFIRLIYSNYHDHASIQEQNKIHLEGFKSDLLLFNHHHNEDQRIHSSSKQNRFEAQMIIRMVDYMLKNRIQEKQITILTTYIRQALYIQQELRNRAIKVQSIDNYQGEENDIILLSLVRSNYNNKLGFVAIDNRICVAFSRARLGLYVFGNFDFIQDCIKDELMKNPQKRNPDISDLWLKIINLANQKGVIKDFIELECSSHKQVTKIYDIGDWDQVKNGGCQSICNIKFPCGHTCKKKCHKSDHKQQDCQEQCNKQLKCGHYCHGQCNQIHCPPCKTLIEKKIQSCGHITKVLCSDYNLNTKCRESCNKILNCGHQCSLKCMDDCKNNKCLHSLQYILPRCKHQISIRCDDLNYVDKLICSFNCQNVQICGHYCSGTCGVCFDKFHKPCIQKCDKLQRCGHKCQLLCSQECYMCQEQCLIKCNCNIRCKYKCNQECYQCTRPCSLKCQHSQCNNKCYQICDRQPCNHRCTQTLQCGCQCMGFCGEVCPSVCQVKQHNNQFADKNTIYYQLECECNLTVEAEFLDQYFDKEQENFIHCPKCKQIIWKSSRYQKQVKESLKWFNKLKQDNIKKYDITNDKIQNAINLVNQKLQFIQQNKLKDKDSFLDNILKELKNESKLTSSGRDSKMPYHYFKCIKNQMKCYEKSVKLIQSLNDSLIFQFHKHNLITEYLMNENFRINHSKAFWWKVLFKLDNLLLFQQSLNLFQNTKNKQFQDISFEIEDSNFFLDDQKKQEFEKILNKPLQ
ncbi:unnamed protein product [Paramecium sonneborni]|uniref:P-loop containing nucleoside triphosphate hydrolase n=1 Tax=Paramecium sonneborni TaxID=65129 RepID=A0A8S1NGZ0_9CILI|nr:unnamed protein product [Paramecium sonneborni]